MSCFEAGDGADHAVLQLRHQARLAFAQSPDSVEVDASSASDLLAANYSQNRLSVRDKDTAFAMHWQRRSLGSIRLASLRFGASVNLDQSPTPFVLVSTQLQGCTALHSPQGEFSGKAGLVMIDSLKERTCKQFSADSWRLHLQFPVTAVESASREYHGGDGEQLLRFDSVLQPSSVAQVRWLSFLNLLLSHLVGPETPNDRCAASLQDMALLILVMHAAPCREVRQSLTPRHVKRAEAFIHENLRADLSLQDIAQAAGVSIRSLCEGFQRARQQSPMQFVRNLRLDGARKDLLNSTTSHLVAEVAEYWGFNHLGRFSEQYRQRFGELPSQTFRR